MEALGINLPGLITQIVSFLILFGLLWMVLYRPITRMLDQRSAKIKESLETAEKVREESAKSKADMQKQIDAARTEGQALIAQAREVADRFRDEELAKARTEIQAARVRAEADIKRERDAAIEDLRREFAGMAVSAAEKIVERSLDKNTHKDLIDKVLKESSTVRRS
ncbi:MAG: F0F1 ATP synthase subunit B [SAR202 cluster bacterium]|nr:F0F1 ATP synthase subunit B [SAR202 cluster bacterium]